MRDEDFELKTFTFGKNQAIELWTPKGLPYFSPNIVTKAIADSVPIPPGAIIAEAGAGIGPLTILMAQKQPLFQHIYTTEIVQQQVEAAKRNMIYHGLEHKVTVLQGDVLQPILERREIAPTMIVGDCSALTNIGIELGWYPEQGIPTGGEDGTEVVTRFLKESSRYQCPTYFAIAPNFSNGPKILEEAEKCFGRGATRHLKRVRIPLLEEQIRIIEKTKTKIYESIERRGLRGLWALDTYEARGLPQPTPYHPNPEF